MAIILSKKDSERISKLQKDLKPYEKLGWVMNVSMMSSHSSMVKLMNTLKLITTKPSSHKSLRKPSYPMLTP